MKSVLRPSFSTLSKYGLAAALMAALAGVAFAAWMDRGAKIFMAMAETGLSWCF